VGPAESWIAARIAWLVPLWLSLSVHEWAHALAAKRLGDDTAERLGRLTLNPLAHADPIGTLLLPLLGVPIGWAKPVPVNPSRFHRGVSLRGGLALTAAAGPTANLALTLASVVLLLTAAAAAPGWVAPGSAPRATLETLAVLNLALALFNALPVPPLDGSRVLEAWLPLRLEPAWRAFLRGGDWALAGTLLAILWLGGPVLLWPLEQLRMLLAAAIP
jgi:Zn-dependent protease